MSLLLFSCGVHSEENLAEKMFAEMEEKDGLTYSAMIIGLVKVCSLAVFVCHCVCQTLPWWQFSTFPSSLRAIIGLLRCLMKPESKISSVSVQCVWVQLLWVFIFLFGSLILITFSVIMSPSMLCPEAVDLPAYNALLQALANSVVPHPWRKAKVSE